MKFVLLLMCSLLLISSCEKKKIEHEDEDLPYLNFNFSTTNESLMKGTPQNNMSNYDSVSVLLYAYDDTEDYNPSTLPSTLTSYGKVKLSNADATGTVWNYAPPKFWPANRKLTFFAYSSNLSFKDSGITISNHKLSIPTITYSVPIDVRKQPDLLVSTPVVDMTKESNGGSNKIKLTMNHALSCISFAPISILERKVESIEIKNVYGTADLNMSSIPSGGKRPKIQWENYRDKGNITFSAGINSNVNVPRDLPDNTSYLMNGDGYLMMIPQTTQQDSKIVVKYSDSQTLVEIAIPTIEWEAGKKYVYSWGSGGVVTYYEVYADNNIGFYYYDIDGTLINTIRNLPDVDNAGIAEAGYGVLSYGPVAVKLKWGNSEIEGVNAMFGVNAKVGGRDFYIYPVSQTKITNGNPGPFALTPTNKPQKLFINGEETYGYCLPHFAKGVYPTANDVSQHYIRTPQQMINISVNTYDDGNINYSRDRIYKQENNLSFGSPHSNIGGAVNYTTSIVCALNENPNYGVFAGTYDGQGNVIKSMNIRSGDSRLGLFQTIRGDGTIRNLTIDNTSTINGIRGVADTQMTQGTGAFAGTNRGTMENLKNYANVTATNKRNTGGICGYIHSDGKGAPKIVNCHNYGNILGRSSVGGIVGSFDADDKAGQELLITVSNCSTNKPGVVESNTFTTANVNGTGGICGTALVYGTQILIEKCYNNGTNVLGQGTCIGGVIGITNIGKSTNSVTGGNITIKECAFYDATVKSTYSGTVTSDVSTRPRVGGIMGSANKEVVASGTIRLENLLVVSRNAGLCPITSSKASGDVNPQGVDVGGIVGYADLSTSIGNAVYIGVVPKGLYNNTGTSTENRIYPVVGDDGGATFDTGASYYYLKNETDYNNTKTRYELAAGYTTSYFQANISSIITKLGAASWESVYNGSGYPYPKLKTIAIPEGSGWWPVAN